MALLGEAAEPPRRSSRQRVSRYQDLSTDDDLDADDPGVPPEDVITWEGKADLSSKVKPRATHIIFMRDGSGYPALVTKISKTKSFYYMEQMARTVGGNTWYWPDPAWNRTCKWNEIAHIIPAPDLANNRGQYNVVGISRYWPNLEVRDQGQGDD